MNRLIGILLMVVLLSIPMELSGGQSAKRSRMENYLRQQAAQIQSTDWQLQ